MPETPPWTYNVYRITHDGKALCLVVSESAEKALAKATASRPWLNPSLVEVAGAVPAIEGQQIACL